MAPEYGPTVGHMKPRGLLIANPKATSTSAGMRDVITRALGHEVDLEVVTTTHKGHAEMLASESNGLDLLITLGGDGTINEAVNGMLNSPHTDLPMLAAIPGGSANVMARALGFPNDAIEATGMILESLRTDSSHTVGLGNAHFTALESGEQRSHWFTINAGVGIDADVIASMEAQRAAGRAASPTRYVWTAAQEYVGGLGRRGPSPLSLQLPGRGPDRGPGPGDHPEHRTLDVLRTVRHQPVSPGLVRPGAGRVRPALPRPAACGAVRPADAARQPVGSGPRAVDPAARRGGVHDPVARPRLPCSSTGTSWATSSSVYFRYTPHALRIVG